VEETTSEVVSAAADDVAARRAPENDWRVLLGIFLLAGIVESQAFGHLNAFTPLFLRQLDIPNDQVPVWTGILSSLTFVIGLPLLPLWGVWADRYSRKLIIVRSAYVEGILFTVAALSPNVWVLAVARLLGGFVFGNTGVMLAMLADSTPRKRLGLAVRIASAGFPIGSSIGPYIGGLIAQGPGIRTLLLVDAIASALMGVALTLVVRNQARRVAIGATVRQLLGRSVRAVVASPVVVRLFVLYFCAVYGTGLVMPFVPILIDHLYTGPRDHVAGTIGATLTAAGIAMAITTPLWGRLGDVVGRWRILPICLAAMTLGLAGEGLAARLFTFQGAVVWIGLFQGGVQTTILALLALLTPEEHRAPVLTFSLLPSQLSWFIGPITGAGLAAISLRLPFAVGTVAMAGAFVLAVVVGASIGRQPPRPQEPGMELEPILQAADAPVLSERIS
jgi:MFS family permease